MDAEKIIIKITKQSKRLKDLTLFSFFENVVIKITVIISGKKRREGKIVPSKRKKKKKHEIGTKNTGQKNIEKKNDFREKIEKRLKSLRALGKTISLLLQRTESRIMERFTREMWLHEILHDRRNDTELKRCSKLRGSLRID